jgi:hypothetical protein
MLDYSRGLYFTAASLCEAVIYGMKGELLTPETRRPVSLLELWEEIGSSYLVVLDEVGSRSSVSDHHYEQVKRLIDVREGKPLVVCSNLSLPELLSVYDDRIISRLAGGTVVCVHGPDRRVAR